MKINFSNIKNESLKLENELVEFLSKMIAIGKEEGGTSGKESDRANLILQHVKKHTPHAHIDGFGNVYSATGELSDPKNTLWFIGHIDTVSPGDWGKKAYSPIVKNGRIYGRGSSDQLAGVASSFIALKILDTNPEYQQLLKKQKTRVIVIGNPHEEDCEGESIKYILENTNNRDKTPTWAQGLPNIIFTTEPTSTEEGDPRLYFGHRGRFLYQLSISGETGHGAIPVTVPTAKVVSKVVAQIFTEVRGDISKKFGPDTFAFTDGIILSPSQNAHTETVKWNLDLRIAPTSSPNQLVEQMLTTANQVRADIAKETDVSLKKVPEVKIEIVKSTHVTNTGYTFEGTQYLPGPWLPASSPLRTQALDLYNNFFGHQPPYDKNQRGEVGYDPVEGNLEIRDYYNFSTDLTALAQLKDTSPELNAIEFLGLGSGVEEQAHRKDEWCPISSLSKATAYYLAFTLSFGKN